MGDDGFDDRYVHVREHTTAQLKTQAELAAIRERQATTEATLLHEVSGLRQDVTDVKQMLIRAPQQQQAPVQQETAAALALHRALDAIDQSRRGGNAAPIFITLGLIAVAIVSVLGTRFLLGGQ